MGEKPADVALAWLLANPVVTAPIIGPRTLEQLTNGLHALTIKLDKEKIAKLNEIWPGPGGEAPEVHAWESKGCLEGANMKKKLKAICFDADGVVVYPQMQFSKYLNEEYGISPEMTRNFFRGIFNDCLVGKADLGEVLPAYLKDWNWRGSVDQFIATWLERDHVVDARLINVIQHLRRNGFLCCLATSQERNRAEYMKTKMGFQEAFDRLFFSYEIGYQKPDHSYYQYIQTMLNRERESILFVDDMEKNVIAAREFGWNAEIYTEFGEFEKILKKYSLEIKAPDY